MWNVGFQIPEKRALILREIESIAEAGRQDGRAKALSLHAQQAERSARTVRDLLGKDDGELPQGRSETRQLTMRAKVERAQSGAQMHRRKPIPAADASRHIASEVLRAL
jgi:hypothetical protein